MLVLSALAAIIGVAAGGAAWVLVRLIRLITNAGLFHQLSFEERSMTELHVSWTIVLASDRCDPDQLVGEVGARHPRPRNS